MSTWYYVTRNKVEEQEVIRETSEFLVIPQGRDYKGRTEQRIKKDGWIHKYFPTKEEAISYWRERLVREAESAERMLLHRTRHLNEFNEMYPE